jgi:hypothetical protein
MFSPTLPVDGKYWLQPHVHSCWTPRHIVLLDVKRDVYLGITETEGRAIASHVQGWSELLSDRATPFACLPDSDGTRLLDEMISAGMLTRDAGIGKRAVRAATCLPADTSLAGEYSEVHPKITFSDVWSFCKSVIVAAVVLRRGFQSAVNRVGRRLQRHDCSPALQTGIDQQYVERIRLRFEVFERLRPFLFTSRNECLFEALAISEFLAHSKLFPRWVFGVTTDPFAAHCWLQHGAVAITDAVENTSRYTPIMVV